MASKRAKAGVLVGGFGGRGKKKGLVKVMFSIDPGQLDDLRKEAVRRMEARKAGRLDTSEVVREALAAWIAKHGR